MVAPNGGIADFEGARVHGVPGFPFPLYPELKLAIPRPSIGKTLETFQPDLIHAAHPVLLGSAAFYYSSKYQIPLVVSYHSQLPKWLQYYGLGSLEPLAWWGVKSAYNRADLLLSTSHVMRSLLRDQGLQRVELWQRGVDTELYHPDRKSRDMRIRLTQGHPEDKLLLYVGRLSAEKDIEKCRAVLEEIPNSRLALVGDGPHRAKLERYFEGTRTYFAGYLKGVELASAFASADVFFLPSRTETLGLVLMEAMAAGCPVVATRDGGVTDIVDDGVTGHLYDPNHPSEAICAIRELFNNGEHHERVRQQARIDVEQWSWAAATRQLEGFYREVIQRDQKLPRQIAECRSKGSSNKLICEALEISLATLRRHNGRPA